MGKIPRATTSWFTSARSDGIPTIRLQPWAQEDLQLLHATLGDARMMQHLGGIETPQQIAARNARYLRGAPGGGMYSIRLDDGTAAGSIGFWERDWRGEPVYETGWMVLPGYAGRGIASEAARAIAHLAASEGRCRSLHAFPSVDNAPSNAVCRKAGFTNAGECEFEYPKGHFMRCNDWYQDLAPESAR